MCQRKVPLEIYKQIMEPIFSTTNENLISFMRPPPPSLPCLMAFIRWILTDVVVGVGIMFGVYIYAKFFTQISILPALLVGVVTYASILVVFTHFPSTLSVRFLPWVFTLLVTLLIAMYLMEG